MTKPTKRVEAEKVARKVLEKLETMYEKFPVFADNGTDWYVCTVAELRAICEEIVTEGQLTPEEIGKWERAISEKRYNDERIRVSRLHPGFFPSEGTFTIERWLTDPALLARGMGELPSNTGVEFTHRADSMLARKTKGAWSCDIDVCPEMKRVIHEGDGDTPQMAFWLAWCRLFGVTI